jgi:hypothetical protein
LARRFPECGQTIPTPIQAPAVSSLSDKEHKREDRDRDYYELGLRPDPVEINKRDIDKVIRNSEAKEKYIKANAKNFSGTFKSSYRVPKSGGAFAAYSSHIKTMIKNADTARAKLLDVIDKLFLIVEMNPTGSETSGTSSKPAITIHPELTYERLDELINQAREMIIQLYVGCERDFYTGMKLLHVIIEGIMQTNMQASLAELKNTTRKAVDHIAQNVPRSTREQYDRRHNAAFEDKVLTPEQTAIFAAPEDYRPPAVDAAVPQPPQAKPNVVDAEQRGVDAVQPVGAAEQKPPVNAGPLRTS